MKKIGILGGTFNPPHIGHLIMANEVLHALDLDEIRFMPNNLPPHKETTGATNEQRLHMVRLAIEGHPNFHVEPFEIEEGGISYTVGTMKKMTLREPDAKFYFIIGGDSVQNLHTWYRIEELIKYVQLVGVKRPGTHAIATYPVQMIETPAIDLSSSLLRQRFQDGQSVRYLVPSSVEAYIREEGLYGSTKLS